MSSASSSSSKPNFSVYQNPTFSAALTARSLRPSKSTFLSIISLLLTSGFSLLFLNSKEKQCVSILTQIHVSLSIATFAYKSLQAIITTVFMLSLSALIRALWRFRNTNIPKEKENALTRKQLGLLGIKTKPPENVDLDSSKKKPISPQRSEPLVPIRRSSFSVSTPSRTSRMGLENRSSSSGKKTVHASSPPSHTPQYMNASPSTPWSRHSSNSAKGILTEAMLEQYLANVNQEITDSAVKSSNVATPQTSIWGYGMASPGSVLSSATASGMTRSTPLRPVRMSPGSHQKYSTPPTKGEGDLPSPMSMEQEIEAFDSLGVYPQIEQWRDRIRQWFSSNLIRPLLDKIETSHIQVMQSAAAIGINIAVTQVGSDLVSTTVPLTSSPIDGAKEWQPAVTVDEDELIHQLRASLVQARDGLAKSPLTGQQQAQQYPSLPMIQQCIDAITEHQKFNTLMKGELIKGLLPHSSVRADYTVQRVRELAEGTCLKNYNYGCSGDEYDKVRKKWTSELPSDSHILLYLFCAFLEHPKWMLHVDPASYSSSHSSKNPLFLGVLPPKDRFPEKYVAVISGVPSFIHPGACILSVGKQSPPVFALYWDTKAQFSLQGRTALFDALLLLCYKIKVGYGGVVRGVHLSSSAFNILSVLDTDEET